jgi:hypothetical protein
MSPERPNSTDGYNPTREISTQKKNPHLPRQPQSTQPSPEGNDFLKKYLESLSSRKDELPPGNYNDLATMSEQETGFSGYALKAGQLTYDCRYSTMHGMPVTGGRGFRGLKPLWYNGVPP